MKPASVADPLPPRIEVLRARRSSVELRLEEGRLVARAPRRMPARELEDVLAGLRRRLWEGLRRKRVFEDSQLEDLAAKVARRRLADLSLPPFSVRFSRRQRRRWGSCTTDGGRGSIRISERLRGHPTWVLEHLLLHELIHLEVADHGPRFAALLARCPHAERAGGYLEALESLNLLGEEIGEGPTLLARLRARVETDEGEALAPPRPDGSEDLPLFDPLRRRP